MAVNDSGEFTDALGFVVCDRLEQFEVRRPEDLTKRLEVFNRERRRLRVDTLASIEGCKRVLEVAAIGR